MQAWSYDELDHTTANYDRVTNRYVFKKYYYLKNRTKVRAYL